MAHLPDTWTASLPAGSRRGPVRLSGWLPVAALVGLGIAAAVRLTPARAEAAAPSPTDVVAEGGSLRVPRAARERVGMALHTVVERTVVPEARASGTVTFDPRYCATVGIGQAAHVERVRRFEGDVVAPGDALAVLDAEELRGARAELAGLGSRAHAASRGSARTRELFDAGHATSRAVELTEARLSALNSEVSAARRRVAVLSGGSAGAQATELGRTTLRAPIAGTVVERTIAAGESLEPDHAAFRIADPDHLWVEVSVDEAAARRIQPGDPVEVRSLVSPDRSVAATVTRVGDAVEEATSTVAVRVEIEDPTRVLRAGQAVTATVRPRAASRSAALVVPANALGRVDGDTVVLVAIDEDHVSVRRVRLAGTEGAEHVVESGLRAGDRVVTNGAAELLRTIFR